MSDAWIKTSEGKKIVDFKKSNIHLVGYSKPINNEMTFLELKDHLYTHPTINDAIPYRTSYYKKDWGFCVTRDQYNLLSNIKGKVQVYIDSEFKSNGSLSIGEFLIPGRSKKEILISTYICHPSLANDNLSGMLLSAFLARNIVKQNLCNYSYRFVWVPETIGAIAYCAYNQDVIKNIKTGLVVTTVGGPGKFGYKQSLDERNRLNSIIEQVFEKNSIDYVTYPFDINGSDERQYSSQGFGMNVATITKDKYYEYEYYHSSKDDLSFVRPEYIAQSLDIYVQVLSTLDKEEYYLSNIPNCEIMLSKYNLHSGIGGDRLPNFKKYSELDLIRWLMLLSDGETSIGEISDKLDIDCKILTQISKKLTKLKVLKSI